MDDQRINEIDRFVKLFSPDSRFSEHLVVDNPYLNRRLYKFFSDTFSADPKNPSEGINWGMENLKRQTIHLNSPKAFNDPFDSTISFDLARVLSEIANSDPLFEGALRLYLGDTGIRPTKEKCALVRKILVVAARENDKRLRDPSLRQVNKAFNQALMESSDEIVICFVTQESTKKRWVL